MYKKFTRTTVATVAVLGLALMGALPAQAQDRNVSGNIVSETLSTGNAISVYVPAGNDTGYRAASTPILLVLGDGKFTPEGAKSTAESSGLADIAAREQGVVAFISPKATRWTAGDVGAIPAVIARFGDSTGKPYSDGGKQCAPDFLTGQVVCKFPGTKSRIYLFADRSGADFVNRSVVPGIAIPPAFGAPGQLQTWTPAAVYIANASKSAAPPTVDIDVPAYLVNPAPAVAASYLKLNLESRLYGVAKDPGKSAFNRTSIKKGYESVLQHAIQRTSEVNDFMQLYSIPDYSTLGLTVTHESPVVNGAPLEYYQYAPKKRVSGKIPLVIALHGGGNHAEYLVWSTGWADLAAKNGFMLVSVNRHVDRSAADVVSLIDQLIAANPRIDATRIYATGFSMGSVKTWALTEQFGSRLAAAAPMSGSFVAPTSVSSTVTPTIYFAGLSSPLPERPHQNGQSNDIDTRLANLFAQNHVTDDYSYDAATDPVWGITPSSTTVVNDRQFSGVSITVNTYASDDDHVYTALAGTTNGSHEALSIEAKVAWRFMSQFSRNADGTVSSNGSTPAFDRSSD